MENEWHKKTRKRIVKTLENQGIRVITSHPKHINLFREKINREHCLSDADIAVAKDGKIEKIIEVESEPNPKKLIGIIIATHLCNWLRANEDDYPLKKIILEIRYREPVPKSKKKLKLDIINKPLKEILSSLDGSVSNFRFIGESR